MTHSAHQSGRSPLLPGGAAALLLGLLAGCSGSDDASGSLGSSSGPFALNEVSVATGQIWQVNRPIRFTFSSAVDFSTVNLNTISIQQLSGLPAIGEFSADMNDPRVIIFQPVCPTQDDFGDAGFQPGGLSYRIDIPTAANGATTVRSTSNKALSSSFPVSFTTPATSNPSELFLDPQPGPASPVIQSGLGTSLQVGGLGGSELYFDFDSSGNGVLPGGTLVPNNFYSDPSQQVYVNLRLNQPVSPKAANISTDRLQLQFLNSSSIWQDLNINLDLVENCAGTGATVRMTPIGILPQGSSLRVVITPQFEDLVGERNTTALDNFALMTSETVGQGGDAADEFVETFLSTEFEDTTAALEAPRASWSDGGLTAAFDFDGTGGPAGQFDLFIAPNQDVVFDTTSSLFLGGPGGLPQFSQLAVNGRLDVRDLFIPATSSLRISGPNPAVIYATGDVTVEGRLSVDGGNAKSVFTLNTPNQPETGGAGNGGGGAGGTGSFLTTQVTPRGGNGFGAFGVPNLGGEGGESGWNTGSDTGRRPGGGGGGVLGHDQRVEFNGVLCGDQSRIGLDVESGFAGVSTATSSQGPHYPYGGFEGPSPFGVLPGVENDFYGTKITEFGTAQQAVVTGELTTPIPGTGGGAGGDATRLDAGETYPPSALINNRQDKGAGGGGGGGALTILALGDITVGANGSITARGGHGNGGENTGGVNRIGGGSGGGSGGYIVLQTAGRIDLSAGAASLAKLDARGGQGGDGAGGQGGAFEGESTPQQDSIHRGINNITNQTENPWVTVDPECLNYHTSIGTTRYNTICAGGDGGPGIIQLHVGDLTDDVLYPGNQGQLVTMSAPVPVGYDIIAGAWQDQLLPIFGRLSAAQSTWIPLGEVTVDPGSPTLGDVAFLFGGTNTGDGSVLATGGTVDDLAPVLTEGSLTLDGADPTQRTAVLDATGLDAIYTQNPLLVRRWRLKVGSDSFEVVDASYDAGTTSLHVTVSPTGNDLSGATGAVELIPRYFGITTGGVEGALPTTASIEIEFEFAQEDPENPGLPSSTATSGFVTDPTGALPVVDTSLIRYMRYRVTFDITGGVGDLNAQTPRPTLDFLRLPFEF